MLLMQYMFQSVYTVIYFGAYIMKLDVTFDNLISIIRECQGLSELGFSETEVITETTLLDKDLGITGDDGWELLGSIETQFGVSFTGQDGTAREFFGLAKNEQLFHHETDFGLRMLIKTLFHRQKEHVKPLSIGQLYTALCIAKNNDHGGHAI